MPRHTRFTLEQIKLNSWSYYIFFCWWFLVTVVEIFLCALLTCVQGSKNDKASLSLMCEDDSSAIDSKFHAMSCTKQFQGLKLLFLANIFTQTLKLSVKCDDNFSFLSVNVSRRRKNRLEITFSIFHKTHKNSFTTFFSSFWHFLH